jgi:transposase
MKRKGKVSMEKTEQIRIMSQQGRSIRTIARCLKMSRKTVRKYLETEIPPKEITKNPDNQNESLKILKEDLPFWAQELDIEYVLGELRKGITYKNLHSELSPNVGYFGFWKMFRKIFSQKKQNISMRIIHKPAEKAFVDFCDGIEIIHDITGEVIKTQLFVATLPFSQYTFAEFTFDQKLETFIEMHEKTWRFFGGVPEYTVPDNLKSGVTKAHRYDPDCNKTYCDYANHAGFAVLPARPVTPRDKASVEGNIHHIQRSFFQIMRHKKYFNILDLNRDLKDFLTKFNNNIMKDYGISRLERFSTEEPLLKPLPKE